MQTNYTWYNVSYKSNDGVKLQSLYMGGNPAEALKTAKEALPGCKAFKVGKTAYNTFGEKVKNK